MAIPQFDFKETSEIVITWSEDSGKGHLNGKCDENPNLSAVVRWSDPITAASDSDKIANAICDVSGAEIVAIDHDKEHVIVTVRDEREEISF